MRSLLDKVEQYIRENYELPQKQLRPLVALPPVAKKVAQKTEPLPISTPVSITAPVSTPPPTPPIEHGFQSVYTKIAPAVALQPPPSDVSAKRVKDSWRDKMHLPAIPIFIDESMQSHSAFLSNIASAINTVFAPSQIYDITLIEKENRWANLFKDSQMKFLIVPDVLLWKSPHLITYYREVPNQLVKRIAEFPLFLLQDLDSYYKTPELKASLWNALLQNLQSMRR